MQKSRHTVNQNDDFMRLAQDWRQAAQFLSKYFAFRDELISILSKFQSMWDEHLGRINVKARLINLVDDKTQPIYSAPYRVRPINK